MVIRKALRLACVGAVLAVAACAPEHAYYGPPGREPARADVKPERATEAAIERAMDHYSAMLAMMDADGVAAMYAPNGVMERQSGPPLRGREAIRAYLASPPVDVRVVSNRMTTISLSYNGPEVVQNGEFEQRARVNGKMIHATGRFEVTWVRGPQGSWYIQHMATFPSH
ncbi:MAG: DUF4440 domain-containing protein [Alphaproteobacteria bacterium]|nr:DUF4440 domain-containing protein [Alphaproteobacteria bacterium]